MVKALKTRILRRLGLTEHLFYFESLAISDSKYKIPILRGQCESILYMGSNFMHDILSAMSSIVPIQDFVDVGANCGQTLIQLMTFSKDIRYYGFEPNPLAFVILNELAVTNNIPCSLFPVGCSDQNTLIPIFKSEATDTAATILPEIRPDLYKQTKTEYVACFRLDDVLDKGKLSKNFLLKIDVEGAELKVLQGARHNIANFRPIICCEVLHADCDRTLALTKKNKEELKIFLDSLDYHIFAVDHGLNVDASRPKEYCLRSLQPIETFPVDLYQNAPDKCDFLFVPRELSEAVRALKSRETANA